MIARRERCSHVRKHCFRATNFVFARRNVVPAPRTLRSCRAHASMKARTLSPRRKTLFFRHDPCFRRGKHASCSETVDPAWRPARKFQIILAKIPILCSCEYHRCDRRLRWSLPRGPQWGVTGSLSGPPCGATIRVRRGAVMRGRGAWARRRWGRGRSSLWVHEPCEGCAVMVGAGAWGRRFWGLRWRSIWGNEPREGGAVMGGGDAWARRHWELRWGSQRSHESRARCAFTGGGGAWERRHWSIGWSSL